MCSSWNIITEGDLSAKFSQCVQLFFFHSWNSPLKLIFTKALVHWRKNRTLLYRLTRQFLWREETPFLQVILLKLIILWAVQWYLLWRSWSKCLSSSSLVFLANVLWTILRRKLLLCLNYLCSTVRNYTVWITCVVFLYSTESIPLYLLQRSVKGWRIGFSVCVFNAICDKWPVEKL